MPGSHLTLLARWQMIYYSCETFSGPRGIRTLGLLNAIETRSQLRYGPKIFVNGILPANRSSVNMRIF